MSSTVRAGVIGHGAEEARYGVVAWLREGLLPEKYRHAPGPAEKLPKQSPAVARRVPDLPEPGLPWRLRLPRGAIHAVPVRSLSVVHPGEVHSARDSQERLASSSFRMMYAKPPLLTRAAAEVAGRREAQPFFRGPIILDKSLAWDSLRLHVALEGAAPRLEQDARLVSTLTRLVTRLVARHAGVRPAPPPGRERRAVGLARKHWRTTPGGACRWKSSPAWRT